MTREGKEPMAPAPSAPCEPSAPAEPSAPGEPSSAEPVGEQHESHAEKLTYESFCKLAREREGGAASDVELRVRFAALDLDGSGKADLNEYNCHCLREALRRSSSRVIDLFRSWDVDGSGEVDREEFRRAIRQLNLDYVADDAAIDRMFALFDDDDNGTLEYHELRKQLSVGAGKTLEPLLRPGAVDLGPSGLKHRLRRRDSIAKGTKMVRRASVDLRGNQTVQEQLKAVLRANAARVIDLFREWDDDGNGTISKKEFRQGLRLFGLDADRGELDALFDALDKDGGGTLDFKELDKALRNETEEELDGRLKASAASRRLAKSMSAVAAHLTPRSCGSKKRRAAGAAGGAAAAAAGAAACLVLGVRLVPWPQARPEVPAARARRSVHRQHLHHQHLLSVVGIVGVGAAVAVDFADAPGGGLGGTSGGPGRGEQSELADVPTEAEGVQDARRQGPWPANGGGGALDATRARALEAHRPTRQAQASHQGEAQGRRGRASYVPACG